MRIYVCIEFIFAPALGGFATDESDNDHDNEIESILCSVTVLLVLSSVFGIIAVTSPNEIVLKSKVICIFKTVFELC